jgi:hypothetical protein
MLTGKSGMRQESGSWLDVLQLPHIQASHAC